METLIVFVLIAAVIYFLRRGIKGGVDVDKYYPRPTPIKIPLPQTSDVISVRSYSDPAVSYLVNLSKMTCTCPDFLKRRAGREVGSLSRACKHLKTELLQTGIYEGSIFGAVLSDEYNSQYYYVHNEFPAIFGYTLRKEWINVWTASQSHKFGKISFVRFGYSLLEERWSFGSVPEQNLAIEEIIHNVFPVGVRFSNVMGSKVNELNGQSTFTITDEAHKNLLNEFYDLSNSILADDIIDDEEIACLAAFVKKGTFYLNVPPLNEIYSLLQSIMKDGKVSKKEREELLQFLYKVGNTIR